jgi:integrase
MGLGGFPETSLAAARERARAARAAIREGHDPITLARQKKSALRAAAAAALTFRQAAQQYIEVHSAGWSNAKHVQQWQNTLASYAYPVIGDLLVSDIARPHILKILEPIWTEKAETASRLRGRLEAILDWAKGRGHRDGDNPAAWKGNLDAQFPKAQRVKRIQHHAAVAIDDMPQFMAQLRAMPGVGARALEFTILTAARSGEVRGARWGEIDSKTGMWLVPAERMKAKREHRVPLPQAAVALLRGMPRLEGSDLVFPSSRGTLLSDMTLTQVMRRMGRSETVHGFRSTFRDWVAERTTYPGEMAEMALAHRVSNAVEAAYRRGDMLEKRREMMARWANFVLTLPKANA